MVLMYHRVLTSQAVAQQAVQPGMYVLDTVFAQHMTFVKDNFTVLSLQELLSLWKTGAWNEQARYCVVTFDDGWLDNYCHAYPILKRLGLPATIFLPTDYVGSDEWFWPDQLAFLLKVVADRPLKREDVKEIGHVLRPFFNEDARPFVEALARWEQVTDQMIERCKHLPIKRIRELIETLASELKVPLPKDRVIVNWDEVREMSQHGLSFGSHSCSHRILTTITPEDVSDELTRSRQILLGEGVNFVPVFCYPNGNSDSHIQSQVQASGYEAAVTVQMGVEGSRPKKQFAINRVGIHNDVTSTIQLFSFRLFGPMQGSA
ncbi:MAG: polysaccharide deacetylase family protein [Pseudobdellovibrionaceae bacterium]|nr:polysaccharide deacetylase family protein [Pseudobdellovibrionaceae bacterium]